MTFREFLEYLVLIALSLALWTCAQGYPRV